MTTTETRTGVPDEPDWEHVLETWEPRSIRLEPIYSAEPGASGVINAWDAEIVLCRGDYAQGMGDTIGEAIRDAMLLLGREATND